MISFVGSWTNAVNNPTSGFFSLSGISAQVGDLAICWWYTRTNTKDLTDAPTTKHNVSSPGYGRLYVGYTTIQQSHIDLGYCGIFNSNSVSNSTTIWGVAVFRGVDVSGDPFIAQSGSPAAFTDTNDPDPPAVTTTAGGQCVVTLFGKNNDYTSIATPLLYGSAMGNGGSNSSTAGGDACGGLAYDLDAFVGVNDPAAWTLGGGATTDDGYVWTAAIASAAEVATKVIVVD